MIYYHPWYRSEQIANKDYEIRAMLSLLIYNYFVIEKYTLSQYPLLYTYIRRHTYLCMYVLSYVMRLVLGFFLLFQCWN